MPNHILDDFQEHQEQRPQMVNVLTILTFIWSGMILLFSVYNLLTKTEQIVKLQDSIEEIEKIGTSNIFLDKAIQGIELSIEHFSLLYSVNIFVAIVCISAAIIMRKMQKSGYFLYLLGCIAEIAIPAIAIGGAVIGGMLLVNLFFSLVFVILYGVNLKHMK
ncbi:MAG: hypothetical protein ABF242_07325 [Flavobacteriales bacterium]